MAVTSFEKGMEKGVKMGMETGQRDLLRRQLERRFGPLNAEAQERLASWPSERLPELAEDLITAASLKELGLED